MENIIGHENAKKKLLNNKEVSSWLICGEKGIGKATLAYSFARHLVGQNNLLEYHPDILIMNDNEEPIVIEKIRQIKHFLHLSPAKSSNKVVIINSMDSINNNASNALLKILEEPPQNSTLLLISHRPHALSQMIRSRCFTLNLLPLSESNTKKIIQNNFPDLMIDNELTSLFSGIPGMFKHEMSDEIDFYKKLINVITHKSDSIYSDKNMLINTSISFDQIEYIILSLILKIIKGKLNICFDQDHEGNVIKNIPHTAEYWLEKWLNIQVFIISANKFNLEKKHTLLNIMNIIT